MTIQEYLNKIRELKIELDKKRPLNEGELRELRKWYDVTYTYNSNAIEGNSLTLAETKVVIEDGITIGGKPLREIYEVKNHKEVLERMFDFVKGQGEIEEGVILNFHKVLLNDIDTENAGIYRNVQVYISGSEDILPPAKEVPSLMRQLYSWYEESKNLNPCLLAAKFHYKFVKIHPFIDGNGRMARLLMNLILVKNGFPPVIVPVVRRLEYIRSIQNGEEAFDEFTMSVIVEGLKDYLRMVGE
ncbi:MAG: Fic family protein [Candidatus Peregrinibacteria bacterium]|nr:Fic family protein [Candidatus Peregrinibacteria bacterium]